MTIKASCHCGQTQFAIDIEPQTATRCTCTFCTKRGVLWAYCDPSEFRLLTPLENGKRYSPTTEENKHYFCPECGCTTYSDNPDYSDFKDGNWEDAEASFDPSKRRIGINLWVLDDFDVTALPVEVIDGRNLW